MAHLLDNNRLLAVVLGGICFMIAIPFTLRVQEVAAQPMVQSSPLPREAEAIAK